MGTVQSRLFRRVMVFAAGATIVSTGIIALPSADAVVGRPSWSAGQGRWPAVAVTPAAGYAAWIYRASPNAHDRVVKVCRMPAGGAACSHVASLPIPAGVNDFFLGDTRPTLRVAGSTVKVAAAGTYSGPGIQVWVWTSTNGGVTFGSPVAVGPVQTDLGGLVFGPQYLYGWSAGAPGGTWVSVMNPANPSCAECGSVIVSPSFQLGTQTGGVIVRANGDLFLVAADFAPRVRVWRLAAGLSAKTAANWKVILTGGGEELASLWTEGLVANGNAVSLLTDRASDRALRVRRLVGSAFAAPVTIAKINGDGPATAIDGLGHTYVYSQGVTSRIIGRLVSTSAGAPFRVLPTTNAIDLLTAPVAALGGSGYGIYGYGIDSGSNVSTQRFVPFRVPHALTLTATKSTTIHRYLLRVSIPVAEVPGSPGHVSLTIAAHHGAISTILTSVAVPTSGVLTLSVRPTTTTAYTATVVANGWWTARAASLPLNPR